MSYQVIARKYRPQRFAEVVGQDHVTQTLANAIAQKRIAHAYLFCGPRGTGKTTIARIFAKCLRCADAPTATPCNACPECRAISEGRSIDMMEFDAASNTQVDKIRDIIIDHVKYAPTSGTVKLYLVDEVHMLSASSFNALLKTLEEPPEHVKFLFATTDPEKLPTTILSRCQRFDLRRIPTALIVQHVADIARQEQVRVDEAAVYAMARGADGSLRDAESALDQLISFCGEKIVESDALSMFGLTAQAHLLDLSRVILTGEIQPALRQLDQLIHQGKDLGRLLADLLNHFRNLLLFQVSRGDLSLLAVSETEAAALKAHATLASTDAVTRILEVLADTELRLRDAASKQILLEIALLKAIEARTAVSVDAVLKILHQLRNESGAGTAAVSAAAGGSARASVPPAQPSETPAARTPPDSGGYPAPTPTPVTALAETPDRADGLEELWARVVEAVGRVSQFTKGYLVNAHPVSLARNVLTVGFDPEFEDYIGLVDNARNHELLQTKLRELGHAGVQVKFVKAEAGARPKPAVAETPAAPAQPSPPPAPAAKPAPPATAGARDKSAAAPASQDDFKNDPLIQKALEVFKGRLANVRG